MLTDIGLEPCHRRLCRAYPRRQFSLGKASCGSSLQDIIQKLELLRQRIIVAPNEFILRHIPIGFIAWFGDPIYSVRVN